MKSPTLPLLLAGLLMCSGTHATDAAHVYASHAWIRVLPGNLPAGAYVTLKNDGDQPVALKTASSPAYASVMLHHSSTKGGMSKMTMVKSLAIPAHGKVILAPAGYHLMLMQAKATVNPGDTVEVTLKFDDGSTLSTDFRARPANALNDGETSGSPAH
ncbi:MAG: copper chaperone PCu(A)C [Rhodanobacter sp.]